MCTIISSAVYAIDSQLGVPAKTHRLLDRSVLSVSFLKDNEF